MKKNIALMFKISKKFFLITLLFSAILVTEGYSQNQHKTHVHGTSQINMAIENNTLQIEFTAPLMDIVGFEGKSNTKSKKLAIEKASLELQNWQNIFAFNGGSCRKIKILISTGHTDEKNTHKHQSNNKSYNHSDVNGFYEFNCTKLNSFTSIKVLLFEKFSRMQKINAQWVTIDGQGQKLLTKKHNKIVFR